MLSQNSLHYLKDAGWYSGRSVCLDDEINALEMEGYNANDDMLEFVKEYIGLSVEHKSQHGDLVTVCFSFKRAIETTYREVVLEYSNLVGKSLVPFGTAFDDHMVLCLSESLDIYAGFDETLCLYGVGMDGLSNLLDTGSFVRIA